MKPEKTNGKEVIAPQMVEPTVSDTICTFNYKNREWAVAIKVPQTAFNGTILLLQGWNFPNTDWCDSTDFCEQALKEGYVLVMPEMGKSIYHAQIYPQTRKDWHQYPTRTWLVDTVIAQLNTRFHLFAPEHNNYVMGLSTGGRGALLIAEENPSIFVAGASLSGDYDQSAFPDDNLYRGYFGADPTQWHPIENPIASIAHWEVPMYIGHGREDVIVSPQHMIHLRDLVKKQQRDMNFLFKITNGAGHNYTYWASEVSPILSFFQQQKRTEP